MTKKEALELEIKCDNLLSESTGYTCTVSQALGGNLRIQFGENNMTISRHDLHTPEWMCYCGEYDCLREFIKTVQEVIKENRSMFERLMWSYEHVQELEE